MFITVADTTKKLNWVDLKIMAVIIYMYCQFRMLNQRYFSESKTRIQT